jgi:hypothetical protein
MIAKERNHACVADFQLILELVAVDKKAETTQPLQRRRAGEGCGANVNSRRAKGSTVCDWQATVVATGLADLSRLSCG